MYIALLVLGVALAWGFLTDWTFSGLLPREGARCTPGDDEKVENAEQHVYDEDNKCTVVQSCKTGWKPDESKTACISSITGMLCDFKGTKITKGVYRYSPQNVCELSGCTDGYVVDGGECVPPCSNKTLDNAGDIATAESCGLLTEDPVCYKVSGVEVMPKSSLDFTNVGDAANCFSSGTTIFIRNQEGKDRSGLDAIGNSTMGGTLAACGDACGTDSDCTGFSYTANNSDTPSVQECILRKASGQNTPTDSTDGFVFYRKYTTT